MREGTTSRPYGEFYDFYSFSPEYFGYTLVSWFLNLQTISTAQRIYIHIRSRTMNAVHAVATTAIHFPARDVLVIRDILQFED
jgi:hypothetical protein